MYRWFPIVETRIHQYYDMELAQISKINCRIFIYLSLNIISINLAVFSLFIFLYLFFLFFIFFTIITFLLTISQQTITVFFNATGYPGAVASYNIYNNIQLNKQTNLTRIVNCNLFMFATAS